VTHILYCALALPHDSGDDVVGAFEGVGFHLVEIG